MTRFICLIILNVNKTLVHLQSGCARIRTAGLKTLCWTFLAWKEKKKVEQVRLCCELLHSCGSYPSVLFPPPKSKDVSRAAGGVRHPWDW